MNDGAPADENGDAAAEGDEPSREAIVRAASEAAEGLVFSRYTKSEVRDLDVTVTFEEGVLDVDVYLNVPDDDDQAQVAEDAALAARAAVDDLFDEA
jgi:hypothetical protein